MSDCIAAESIIDRVIETVNGAGPPSDDSVAVIAVVVPPVRAGRSGLRRRGILGRGGPRTTIAPVGTCNPESERDNLENAARVSLPAATRGGETAC